MSGADGSVPTTLSWPLGARLEITATTATTADLKWPDAVGPVASYRVSWPAGTRDELGTTTSFAGLALGQHLPVDVIAVAADGTETSPLHAEVASATKLEAPDGDISTDFCGANAFLRQGSAAIPCEVFSALVGHVRTRDGVGVPGMRISVLDHPEWGSTTSQADGLYALAVAAGRYTLEIRASSFIPIQRLTVAKAHDFTYLPDTAVLRRDEKATAVSTVTGGFHSATPQEDKDGQRTTSVFIPGGTSAWLRLTDGGTQPVTTLTLRATEATVGPSGPETMPASLPGATAYTFAADISADEALGAGARGVGFATPVAMYADNFLHWPVGAAIPLGIYDDATGKWESGPNAAVLQVSAGGGVDYTGDGVGLVAFTAWYYAYISQHPPVIGWYPTVVEARGSRGAKPSGCPTGTKPIDESGLEHEIIEGIKRGIGNGPADWTGISPDGHVWGPGEDGKTGEDYGHWGDFAPGKED